MYFIPYDYPIRLLSNPGLYIDFLNVFLCGTLIFRDFENSCTKTALKFVKLF